MKDALYELAIKNASVREANRLRALVLACEKAGRWKDAEVYRNELEAVVGLQLRKGYAPC